jgi:hypothetical protein
MALYTCSIVCSAVLSLCLKITYIEKKSLVAKNLIVSKGITIEAGHGVLVFSPNAILLENYAAVQ